MKNKSLKLYSILVTGILFCTSIHAQILKPVEWTMNEIYPHSEKIAKILGSPQITDSDYGKVVSFNGETDGIFFNEMPLARLKKFTVEAIVYFAKGGRFDQRFLHIGEIRGKRLLFEIRSVKDNWYFDAYLNTAAGGLTLIDSTLTHPLGQWYHLALVVNDGKLTTYINGKKELEGEVKMEVLETGQTSIGVRLNEVSWFKGSIYKIRITPEALNPKDFISN